MWGVGFFLKRITVFQNASDECFPPFFLGADRDSVDNELQSRGRPQGLLSQESYHFQKEGKHRNKMKGSETLSF